ncbi:hypothetical protein SAMN05877753_102617 [Bacillus oleivorans]|uniref:Uncharacterized protein n=1 Tax=Bacillus oleivorans TaxID=1448271 RepID=A0A285CMH2_9BACI|nr:hypothetical protein SAMN05877753_102617 [Bacillus oleivorans]
MLYKGLFPFQVGPAQEGNKLGVVLLGGHKDPNETPLETAIREVYEEAAMNKTPIHSPITFYKASWDHRAIPVTLEEKTSPLLLKENLDLSLSVMYLAHSKNESSPSSETCGLLLLKPEEICLLCKEKITLNDYIKQNGVAILKRSINKGLVLEPFPHLKFLAKLLEDNPDLFRDLL